MSLSMSVNTFIFMHLTDAFIQSDFIAFKL